MRPSCIGLATVLWLAVVRISAAEVIFVDIAAAAGITLKDVSGGLDKKALLQTLGHGAAWFDYDGDGWLDLSLANGSTLDRIQGQDPEPPPGGRLYRNRGDGTFQDTTQESGIKTGDLWAMGVVAADVENDEDPDLFITGLGKNLFFRNRGDGTFEEVSGEAGVEGGGWASGAAFGDYNGDGFLDLYVARYVEFSVDDYPTGCLSSGIPITCGPNRYRGSPDQLYRNNGDGTFTDVSGSSGIQVGEPYNGLGVIFLDYDNNGLQDIYVANDATPANLWHNNGDGTFSDHAVLAGCAFSGDGREQARMGVDAGDFDHSGHLSLFTTNFSGDINTLFRSHRDGTFSDQTGPLGLGSPSLLYLGWGTGFIDYDNDTWLDVFVVNGHLYPEVERLDYKYLQSKLLFRNTGTGRFQQTTDKVGADFSRPSGGRGAAFADFDNDGDLDVAVTNIDGLPELLRNDGGNRKHFLSLRLVGTRSNRDGVGARVQIKTGTTVQMREVRSGGSFMSHNDLRLHFGLGKALAADVAIRWPSGQTEELENLKANHFYTVRESEGVIGK